MGHSQRGTASSVCNMLLPGCDAVLCERESGNISDSIHIRVAGLQLAVHLQQAFKNSGSKDGKTASAIPYKSSLI